jgi:hypothetical protein
MEKVFYVIRYEHGSLGCAAAIYDDEEKARRRLETSGLLTFSGDLADCIEEQCQWLNQSENRLGFYHKQKEIKTVESPPWAPGALWAGRREKQ